MIIPILDALAVVHRNGVIHRDLKPANIFLAEIERSRARDQIVKILDFGVSKPLFKYDTTDSITTPGKLIGSPQYMPPEQSLGAEIDTRVDLYAVGVILYEMITGERPFPDTNLLKQVVSMMTTEALPPSFHRPEIPEELDGIITKAIARDREDRYASADDFLQALDTFLHSSRTSIDARGPAGTQHDASAEKETGKGRHRSRLKRTALYVGSFFFLTLVFVLAISLTASDTFSEKDKQIPSQVRQTESIPPNESGSTLKANESDVAVPGQKSGPNDALMSDMGTHSTDVSTDIGENKATQGPRIRPRKNRRSSSQKLHKTSISKTTSKTTRLHTIDRELPMLPLRSKTQATEQSP